MTPVERFKELLAAFEAARDLHAAVGAGDTEPRQIGYSRIADAIHRRSRRRPVPVDADGWQLYAPDEEDPDPGITPGTCAAAAADLHRTCQAVVDVLDALDDVRHKDATTIRELASRHTEW